MGKPENADLFGVIQCDDIEVYMAPEIWHRIGPETERILLAIEGYGRFWLCLTNKPPSEGVKEE